MIRLLGAKLRHARLQAGLSQSELARRLGLTRHTHITHMEAGRRSASLELIVRAAGMLRVTTDYLLRDELAVEANLSVEPPDAIQPYSFPPQLLGMKVRQLRSARGWTQAEAMRQLKLTSQGYISHIEANTKEPSPELIVEMARLFDVTIEYLLNDALGTAQGDVSAAPETL